MRTSRQHRRSRSPFRPRLEHLEDRCLLAAYALTDLGTLGGVSVSAADINDAGQVVGTATTAAGQQHAFLWQDGTMFDLGTLGGDHSGASALNDAGQVVGNSRVAPGSLTYDSFLWENGEMTGLGITATQGTFASGINDAGQVVGAWYDGHHWRAYFWDDGAFFEPFPGKAADVNDAGLVAGEWESTRGYPVAAVWGPDLGARELGVLPGGLFSAAYALNDVGQVVGYSESWDSSNRAVLWDDGQMIDLGTLAPDDSGFASAADINNAGQIVGWAERAFIWSDGVMVDLNDLVPRGSGLTLVSANAINDAGQIVANAVDAAGRNHAVLLTPIPGDPSQTTQFVVSGVPSPITAGTVATFTVTAQLADGSTDTNYTGTVYFTSSDPQAGLPSYYTFTAADQGVRTFTVTLKTAGTHSITATDVSSGATGTRGGITVNPAAASRLLISGPSTVNANNHFNLTIIVVDAYGNVVTDYRGTITFRSSAPTGKLPTSYTFTEADKGVHTFVNLTLKKKGKQTITVTDLLDSSLTGSISIDVR